MQMTAAPTSGQVSKHSVIWGVLVGALGFLSQPTVLHFFPEKIAAVLQAIGAIATAFGLIGHQSAQGDKAAAAASAAVAQASTDTAAKLQANASIVAAQAQMKGAAAAGSRAAGSPLQGS